MYSPPSLSLSLIDRSRLIDNAENKVLRAFQRAFNANLFVDNGLRTLRLLKDSSEVMQTLNQLKHFANFDASDVNFYVSVTRWNRLIAQYPGLEFRGFVQGVIMHNFKAHNYISAVYVLLYSLGLILSF
jgi:primosomal protein N''